MTVGGCLSRPSSLLSLPFAAIHHSDSNWSLNTELDFPHFASEDEDWMTFGYLLDGADSAEGADTGETAGMANGPEDDVSEEEYERGIFAPKADYLLADDEDELNGSGHLEAAELDLSDLLIYDNDYEEIKTAPASPIPAIPVLGELSIEIPECELPEEESPILLVLNLRKRKSEENSDLEVERKRRRIDESEEEVEEEEEESDENNNGDKREEETSLVCRLRPRPARPLLFPAASRRFDDIGGAAKKRTISMAVPKEEKERERQVVNPAEISLGGDSVDWTRGKMVHSFKEEDRMSSKSGRSGSGRPLFMHRRQRTPSRSNSESKMDSSADEAAAGGVLMHVPPVTPNRGRGRPRKIESERRRKEAEARMRKVAQEGGDVHTMINPSQLHCICRMPYDDRKFYVACNMCSQWFHGKCIGISEKKAKRLSVFICHDCRAPKDEDDSDDEGDQEDERGEEGEVSVDVDVDDDREIKEEPDRKEEEMEEEMEPRGPQLYCACRTPYDDTQFYVGCDGCEGWFHPACVGITQQEAEMAAEYLCPNCRPMGRRGRSQSARSESQLEMDDHLLSRSDYPIVWQLFEAISEHRGAWPFKEPVDTQEFPTYLQVVKQPIDLSIIQERLSKLQYRRLSEVEADLQLMFDNAKQFNIKGSMISDCAETLEAVFRAKMQETRAEIARNNEPPRRVSESRTVNTVFSSMDIDTDQLLASVDIDPSIFDSIL